MEKLYQTTNDDALRRFLGLGIELCHICDGFLFVFSFFGVLVAYSYFLLFKGRKFFYFSLLAILLFLTLWAIQYALQLSEIVPEVIRRHFLYAQVIAWSSPSLMVLLGIYGFLQQQYRNTEQYTPKIGRQNMTIFGRHRSQFLPSETTQTQNP